MAILYIFLEFFFNVTPKTKHVKNMIPLVDSSFSDFEFIAVKKTRLNRNVRIVAI